MSVRVAFSLVKVMIVVKLYFNKKAFIVLGDYTNIKFTTMDDARYLSYLLKEEEK